jgi:hypothetical protein
MARHVITALDTAAEALTESNPVPQEPVNLMTWTLVPAWMYGAMRRLGWQLQALHYGTWRQLRTQVWKGTTSP